MTDNDLVKMEPDWFKSKLLSKRKVCGSGCWEWQGNKTLAGYGTFIHNKKNFYCHRVSQIVFHGPIPPKHEVRHLCHNPICFSPEHIASGTSKQNKQDMKLADRHQRGSRHWKSRIDEKIVIKIRALISLGKRQKDIAKLFDIDKSVISEINTRRSWSHVA